MQPTRRRLLTSAAALAAGSALPALPALAADPFPARPVTFVVPFPPGGPVDTTARFATQPLDKLWPQAAIIDNRAGAGGIVGAQAVAKARPDGYTYLFAAIHHTVLPSLRSDLTYDIQKDFVPVGMAATFPIFLVVHPSLPVNNVAELIAYAKANPGKLSFSSSGTGGGTHLAGELFNSMAGTDIMHVPYRGSAPAMADLLGGQVQVMFADGPSAVPHVQAGRIRALGVGYPERSRMMPDVPTIAESGVPGYEAYSWSGLVAPAGTPQEIVDKVNADMNQGLNDPAVAKRILDAGAEVSPGTPAEFGKFIDDEIRKWGEVIRKANITVE
ncbi:tripartite tricarboxylate transporter substrate binding protein [Verticiella sediminum]|uniref:Tripartite tricarboxylate transporter substrate binding protein n=1 Tax=Verticiella sediminum TaxID=1247510 RepID=A0A556AYV6_9BURK|nr:tripartite tricarboxylate transporter substrate binding protein [Verticiella sediminum]TSH98119.1 tripartite tricarboxylate transporter substrate binding protein [Verticiella sediminum]